MIYLGKEKKEVECWIQKGIELFSDYPDFYILLADLYSQANRYQDALQAYSIGFSYIENALQSQSAALNQAPKFLTSMGELNLKIGQTHESVKNFMSALNIDKYSYLALLYLLKLFTRFEDVDNTKNFLLKVYDITNKKDLLYLTRACLEVNNAELGGYFISMFNEKDFQTMQEEYAEFTVLSGEFKKAAELYDAIYSIKQSEGMNIKALCSSYLSGDQNLFFNYFQRYSGEYYDAISKCIDSISKDDFYQFIAYLIKLQKVEKVMELKSFIEKQDVELEVADLLFTNEYFVEAEGFYRNISLRANVEGTEMAILLCKQGECLWRSGRNSEAKPLAYKARSLFSQDYRPHILLMSILNETKEIEELKQVVQEASIYFPDSSYIQFVQAVLNNL